MHDIADVDSQTDGKGRFYLMLSHQISGSLAKYFDQDAPKKCTINWISFTNNLWSMFILHKLYSPSADDDYVKEQPIWRVIQFLFVLYFGWRLKTKIIVPQIHFAATWPFPNREYEEYGHSNRNWTDKSEDKEKMKADTGITRYEKGESMQAVCYLSVDWGGKQVGDFDRYLYLATFDISKENDDSKAALRMDFEVAKSIEHYCVDGILLFREYDPVVWELE